ncbi:MFS general substrate transporter [Rhizodiscina lignyota]|uniref:MFS general substrate transporter n=1 Tax=Rhizodiscina lignyota TaxID=1504668 RepID=A0A9P4INK1_9PEZI|nr:MFS general substrate transporter [Rhizodiscina lignyota]
MSFILEYLVDAIKGLKPTWQPTDNPIKLLAQLNRKQWTFFLIGFCGWTWDAFDFFTVSLTVQPIAKTFHKTNADITWGIGLVLMLRVVGATIFGYACDRYGRKWPWVVNQVLFIVLEMATGFTQTFSQFLAVRALFGIAMGGLYGNAIGTALEDAPTDARGLMSGIIQQGYAFGYLLATVFARALVGTTSHEWRPLYWFGAGPPVLLIIWRLMLPETDVFLERRALRKQTSSLGSTFAKEMKLSFQHHWLVFIYMALLLTGASFMAHGSQDLYPTMLSNQYQFSANRVTVTQVVANLGAMMGGTTGGFMSQIVGRRFTILVLCIIGGALLYPYTFVSNNGILAAAFFEQFCVQGIFGVVPVHLMELAPSSIRTFAVGVAYHIGALVSSASATIEATIGEQFPLPPSKEGVKRYEYGIVMCIFLGCVYGYNVIFTVIGPEARGREMRVTEEDEVVDIVGKVVVHEDDGTDHIETIGEKGAIEYPTKEVVEHRETV